MVDHPPSISVRTDRIVFSANDQNIPGPGLLYAKGIFIQRVRAGAEMAEHIRFAQVKVKYLVEIVFPKGPLMVWYGQNPHEALFIDRLDRVFW